MSTQNIALVRRVPLEVFGGSKNIAALDDIFTPDYVEHNPPPGVPAGLEGIKQLAAQFNSAFPDCQYTVDLQLASEDYVTQHLTGRATMTGEFMGMPPTGKSATWTETHVVRVKGGKIVEHWGNQDDLGMLQQFGLLPVPEAV